MGRRPRVTRSEILRAAREAFAERGYEGTTLAAISSRVGLSPAALLRHTPTKEALFAAAMAQLDSPTGKETGDGSPPFFAFLADVPGDADPRKVLRRLGQGALPFFEDRIGAEVARYLHSHGPGILMGKEISAMRRRGLATITDYVRRATEAGRLEVQDPKATAMAFVGSLIAYIFLHRIARIIHPPLPFDLYLDNLIEIWTRGAIRDPEETS
jgi:AcrR family transcriptional regulator